MLSRFRLKVAEGRLSGSDGSSARREEAAAHAQRRPMPILPQHAMKKPQAQAARFNASLNPADVISLDDSNFGKF
ncbi:MAG TPA: hypothetical protein PK542_00420, partial [Treponemataceae bacterium]|nr:hypothetical protein [Treponemataceae bacterium]